MSLRFVLIVLLLSFQLTACASDPVDYTPALPMPSAPLADDLKVSRIALGSCYTSSAGGKVFDEIATKNPDLFVFLGDNVYAADESEDPVLMSLRRSYAGLAGVESFANLRATTPVLPVWDDHDYGKDDAGGDWDGKHYSEGLFEHVWAIDKNDKRAKRPGIYFERTVGSDGERVQLIMLDTRFFRTPLTKNTVPGAGKYVESADPDQNLLGDKQWQWLETQLKKPADVRILVSTIQVIADGHAWEAWRIMPTERERLYDLLRSSEARNVILVSGDRHAASMYRADDITDYPIYELTSSSLNIPLTQFVPNPDIEPGPNRLGDPFFQSNYGLIDINWEKRHVILKIMDEDSRLVQQQAVFLD